MIALSLCDYTGNMVRPWLSSYEVVTVDLQPAPAPEAGRVHWVWDVRDFQPAFRPAIVFAFPPCTHTAVSGARHFKAKGPRAAAQSFSTLAACLELCEASGAPWMIENPVSTFSTYWRKPDYIFHPYEYGGYLGGENDGYTKKTCLWTGNGFVMPPTRPIPLAKDHDRIHKAPPSDERANFRSATPKGFARAVFEANSAILEARAA